jgi:rRNA-processing protein FCF1
MIMDACVLIDFIKADRSVLELIVKHVGALHVASPVVDEVNEIDDENELLELGLVIVEPEIEDAYAAASQPGPTSFQDRLCLLSAKRHGFICVTNDKNLRKLCQKEDIPILWGLQLLAELHHSGGIPPEDALDIAQKIQKANPKHISPQILKRFTAIIQKRQG